MSFGESFVDAPMVGVWFSRWRALDGLTVVLKPDESVPLGVVSGEPLEEAGVFDGVVNVVTEYGAVAGAALSGRQEVDRIVFTGSVGTGR